MKKSDVQRKISIQNILIVMVYLVFSFGVKTLLRLEGLEIVMNVFLFGSLVLTLIIGFTYKTFHIDQDDQQENIVFVFDYGLKISFYLSLAIFFGFVAYDGLNHDYSPIHWLNWEFVIVMTILYLNKRRHGLFWKSSLMELPANQYYGKLIKPVLFGGIAVVVAWVVSFVMMGNFGNWIPVAISIFITMIVITLTTLVLWFTSRIGYMDELHDTGKIRFVPKEVLVLVFVYIALRLVGMSIQFVNTLAFTFYAQLPNELLDVIQNILQFTSAFQFPSSFFVYLIGMVLYFSIKRLNVKTLPLFKIIPWLLTLGIVYTGAMIVLRVYYDQIMMNLGTNGFQIFINALNAFGYIVWLITTLIQIYLLIFIHQNHWKIERLYLVYIIVVFVSGVLSRISILIFRYSIYLYLGIYAVITVCGLFVIFLSAYIIYQLINTFEEQNSQTFDVKIQA
ncbi:MAG: hypothetical protein JXL85_08015 [Bacilli bacterium]|nr:hypothetical protein [Bacilli bacterium]